MGAYVTLFLLSCLLLYLGQRNLKCAKAFLFLGLILPILMAGLRGIDVGTDTKNYKVLFDTIATVSGYLPIVEPFFYIVCKIGLIFHSYSFVLFIYQALSVVFIYKYTLDLRTNSQLWFIFLLYFLLLFNPSLNIMRQCLAVCYLLYISTLLWKHRLVKFCILGILGMVLHTSIIVAIVLYLFIFKIAYNKSKYRQQYIIIYTISCIGIVLFFPKLLEYLGNIIGGYVGSKVVSYKSINAYISISNIMMSLFMIWIYYLANKFSSISRKVNTVLLLVVFTELSFYVLAMYNVVFSRFGLFFSVYYIYYIPLFCSKVRTKINQKKIIYLVNIIFFFFYWYWSIIVNESNRTVPYYVV